MSECASKYFAAIAAPFSSEAMGVCMPYAPDRSSLKVHTYTRATSFRCDSNGNGAFFLAPTVVSDLSHLWVTNNAAAWTFPMPAVTTNTAIAGWDQLAPGGTPFTRAVIDTGNLEARVISVGIRITYTGTLVNLSGTISIYVDPDHGNVNNVNATARLSSSEAKFVRITDRPFEMGFGIVKAHERSYSSAIEAISVTNGIAAYCPWSQGVDINGNRAAATTSTLVNGAATVVGNITGAASGAPFTIEVIQHIEFVGASASYGLTPSHNDSMAEKITAAADRATSAFNGARDSWASTMSRSLGEMLREAGGRMAPMAARYAAGRAMRGLGAERGPGYFQIGRRAWGPTTSPYLPSLRPPPRPDYSYRPGDDNLIIIGDPQFPVE